VVPREQPKDGVETMTKFLAKCAEADETGLLYLVDDAGNITPILNSVYASLSYKGPRVGQYLYLTRPDAVQASLRLRGLPTGWERRWN
jgi:hypothetical protein